MRVQCRARELSARIDEAWERERQERTCPECEGNLSEDGTTCWNCQSSDYLGQEEE
jgi:ribosomal protein L37AE/L43A